MEHIEIDKETLGQCIEVIKQRQGRLWKLPIRYEKSYLMRRVLYLIYLILFPRVYKLRNFKATFRIFHFS